MVNGWAAPDQGRARRRVGSASTRQVSAKPAPRSSRKAAAARAPFCSSTASAWSTAAARSVFGRSAPALLVVEVACVHRTACALLAGDPAQRCAPAASEGVPACAGTRVRGTHYARNDATGNRAQPADFSANSTFTASSVPAAPVRAGGRAARARAVHE